MRYNYKAIGERIRKLRESRGWSQTELIEKLRDHNGAISRNKLSEIESGNYSDFKFSFVTAMCEIFGCDTGYLLCEYDERVRYQHDIHDMIGLSGTAILNLKMWFQDNRELTEIVNFLIESSDFFPMLFKIKRYCIRAEEFDQKKGKFRPAQDVANEADLLSATRYAAVEMFSRILREIYDEDNYEKKGYQEILARAAGTFEENIYTLNQ